MSMATTIIKTVEMSPSTPSTGTALAVGMEKTIVDLRGEFKVHQLIIRSRVQCSSSCEPRFVHEIHVPH